MTKRSSYYKRYTSDIQYEGSKFSDSYQSFIFQSHGVISKETVIVLET